MLYCYLFVIWHVWSSYPNVVFTIIWHFGFTCRIIEVFQFNEVTHVWKEILYWRNMLSTSHNMEFLKKKNYCPIIMSSPDHYKSKNPLSSDDVCWCWKSTSCSNYPEKAACSSHLWLKTPKNAPLQNLIVNGHTHGDEEAWLLVLVNHAHHSPPLALHSNLNPYKLLYPMPNLTN